MLLDKIEAFAALEHFGIRTARAKLVDSAEDAIAFAERRTAADTRAVPIVLRAVGAASLDGRPATSPLTGHDAIRTAYDRLLPTLPETGRILAQVALPPGTDIVIEGRSTEEMGKVVAVRNSVHSKQRMVPLDEAGAEFLATHVQGYGHRPQSDQMRRMLEHLLLHVSDFFEETAVESFDLTVHVHENSYTVADATISSPRHLHLKGRLRRHAHDLASAGMKGHEAARRDKKPAGSLYDPASRAATRRPGR